MAFQLGGETLNEAVRFGSLERHPSSSGKAALT